MEVSSQTLAEMIRLGSKDTEQVRWAFWITPNIGPALSCDDLSTFDRSKVTSTCALGAALLVATDPMKFLKEIPKSIQDEVFNRNDELKQTREQIADWLDTL